VRDNHYVALHITLFVVNTVQGWAIRIAARTTFVDNKFNAQDGAAGGDVDVREFKVKLIPTFSGPLSRSAEHLLLRGLRLNTLGVTTWTNRDGLASDSENVSASFIRTLTGIFTYKVAFSITLHLSLRSPTCFHADQTISSP